MADDTEKLIIEIDADTGQFKVQMGSIQDLLKKTGSEGASHFGGLAESVIGLNQGLELAEKMLEGVAKALETVNKVESWDNQTIALKSLGAQVGLSQQQIQILLDTIKTASQNTMTTVEATQAAFKLLNAGFKAETIPALIEFAHRAEETRNIPMAEGINKLAMALETGTTRGLKTMGIEIERTGSRQQVLNAILEQSENYIKRTGDGYENFGKRIGTVMTEAKEKTESFFGTFLRDIGINVLGTTTEKTTLHLKELQQQMEKVDQAAKAGQKNVELFIQGPGGEPAMNRQLSIQEARALLTQQMTGHQKVLNEEVAKEGKHIEENTKKIKQKYDLEKTTDQFTAQRDRIANQKKMYEALYNDDITYFNNSQMLSRNVEQARRQEIENSYQNEVRNLQGRTLKKGEFARLELEIEKRKYAQLKALDDQMREISKKNLRDGFINGINQMESSYTNFSKSISKLTVGLGNTMSSTFVTMAKNHKFAMDEMLNNMLEFIGESLIQDGTANLLKGAALSILGGAGAPLMAIGGAEIAAGAALVGATSSGGASAGGGSASSSSVGGNDQLNQPSNQNFQEKQATIVINGDLWNSQEGINHLQSLIRNNSDITNFAVVQQGKTW